MEIWRLVSELMGKNVAEYLGGPSLGRLPIPRLFLPAGVEQITGLEDRAGQRLESGYREFLSLTDGMDGFHLGMPLFGCHDWEGSGLTGEALTFREAMREDGTPEDVGLPADIELFPLSIDMDGASAIFMMESSDLLRERIWWVGEGSSSFFHSFRNLLEFIIDPLSYSPRETID
ncbi:SMI1/KNR4 family protein [Streptomyces sp. NPDC059618]|uniref:SMI1/KNR4 family protein n=1 Tax=Streptomyces sp. NPDC059618 TaxID=3346887 RepID=UPI003696B0B3